MATRAGTNAEQGDGAALAAEDLNEKSKNSSKKGMKSKHRGAAGASDAAKGPKPWRQNTMVNLSNLCAIAQSTDDHKW